MSRRAISADDTFFAKVVVSLFLLTCAVGLAWLLRLQLVRPGPRGISVGTIVFRLVLIAAAIGGVVSCIPLKRVALSDTSLHISNFLREIVVPLGDVESVHQRRGFESFVVVRFARRTPFGRQIVFSGIGRKPPQPHPIVAELRAAVAASKAQ